MVLAKSLSEASVGLALYSGTAASVLPRRVGGSSTAGVLCQDLPASLAFGDLRGIHLVYPDPGTVLCIAAMLSRVQLGLTLDAFARVCRSLQFRSCYSSLQITVSMLMIRAYNIRL